LKRKEQQRRIWRDGFCRKRRVAERSKDAVTIGVAAERLERLLLDDREPVEWN
jgi:hypothetical protein